MSSPHHVTVGPSSSVDVPSDNLTTADARYRRQMMDYFHQSIRECPPLSNNNYGSGHFNNVGGDQYNPHYNYYAPVLVNRSEPILPSTTHQSDPEPLSKSYEPTLSNINAICQLLDQFSSGTTFRNLPALLEDMKGFASKIAIVARSLDIINDIPTGIRGLSAFRQAHDLIRCLNAHMLMIQQDVRCFCWSLHLPKCPSLIEIIVYPVIAQCRWWAIYRRTVSLLNADHLVLAAFAHAICSGCGKIIEGEPAQKLEQLIASSPLLKSPLIYHLRMLTLTVRDHAGRRLPIPLEYCSTWSDMRIVLKHLCYAVDGIEYIERDDWEIIRTSNNETLDMDRPLSQMLSEETMLSDEVFDISIIMRVVRASLSMCPGCSYDNSGSQLPYNNWITCGQCQKTFQVISIAPAPPRMPLLTTRRKLTSLPTNTAEPKIFRAMLQRLKKIIPSNWHGKGQRKVQVKKEPLSPAPDPPPVIVRSTPPMEHSMPLAPTNVHFPRISLRAESIQRKRPSHCRYDIHSNGVRSLSFQNNSKHVLSADESGWSVWDADTGVVSEWGSFDGVAMCAAFSPDGSHVAAGFRDGSARMWDIGTMKTPVTLKGHVDTVPGIAFSCDGKYLATWSDDHTIRISPLAGKEATTQVIVCENPFCAALSPDGTLIASSSLNGRINIWDTRTRELQRELEGHNGWVRSISFSPDGTRILSASHDHTVQAWSTSGKPILTFRGHKEWVLAVAWSPDGRHFASGSNDRTVRLWDSITGHTLQVFKAGDYSTSVAFSPDGSHLVSGTEVGSVHVWDTGLATS